MLLEMLAYHNCMLSCGHNLHWKRLAIQITQQTCHPRCREQWYVSQHVWIVKLHMHWVQVQIHLR